MPEQTEDYGESFAYKRVPMRERTVAELNGNDIRAAVIGTVVDVNGERFVVDDGTGTVEVLMPAEAKAPAAGTLVRVIGRVRAEEGVHKEAEAVQQMAGLDVNLYKSLKRLL